MVTITERGSVETCHGTALQIKIFTDGYKPLNWSELYEAFTDAYPGKWALQVFPPVDRLIDGKNVYHLFVIDCEPQGMNLRKG